MDDATLAADAAMYVRDFGRPAASATVPEAAGVLAVRSRRTVLETGDGGFTTETIRTVIEIIPGSLGPLSNGETFTVGGKSLRAIGDPTPKEPDGFLDEVVVTELRA